LITMTSISRMLPLLLVSSVLTISAYNVPPAPPPMSCKFDTGKGASYDLSKLQELAEAKPLTAQDRLQVAQKDYLYTFGICNTVAPPENCLNNDGESRVGLYWGPGWQTNASQTLANTPNMDDRHCFYLGGNGEGELSTVAKWSMLDNEDVSILGATLTYSHGQTYHSNGGGRRSLILNFKCREHEFEKIEKNVMDESAHAKYEITIESEYACPVECGFGGGHSICNNHGVCGYDTDQETARCFCNEGFSGPGCDEKQATPTLQAYGPILALLIFVTIVLVALVGAVVGLWRFMSQRTVPMDGESYARLENDGSFTPMRMDVKGPDGL